MNRPRMIESVSRSSTFSRRWASSAGLAAVLTALSMVAPAQAGDDSAADDRRGQRPPKPPVEKVLDVNGDGIIDRDELSGAAAALLALDVDGDGVLQISECLPARGDNGARGGSHRGRQFAGSRPSGEDQDGRGRRGRQAPPLPPVISALDSDGNDALDSGEISAAAESLIVLDSNGDGRLEPEEYQPVRGRRGGPSGPSGGQKMQW